MKKLKICLLIFLSLILITSCTKHEHTFEQTLSYDDEYHYYASTCEHDVVKDKVPHSYDAGTVIKEATEAEEGLIKYSCMCGYSYTEALDRLPHTHTFSDALSYDDEYHYYASTCAHDVVKDKAPHSFDEGIVIKEATEAEEGLIKYSCICGYSYTETIQKLPHTHTFSDTLSYDDEYHYYASTCEHDVVKDKAPHSYDEGIVIKQATEAEEGIIKYSCICGYSYTEALEKLPHTHTFSDALSYDDEYHYYASTCEHDVVKDKAPHSFDEGIIIKEATEAEEGLIKYSCMCGYSYTETIQKLPHTHTFSDTLSYDDEYHYYASTCAHDVVKDKEAHSYDEGTVILRPTIFNKGLKRFVCKKCKYIKEVELEKLEILSLHINAYNTQGATTGFEQYHGLMLYKAGVTLGSSLYWHKVGLKEVNGEYVVAFVAPSGTAISMDYDYLLLSWQDDSSGMYDALLGYSLTVGEKLKFSSNLDTLSDGSVSLEVSRLSDIFNVTYELGFEHYDTKNDLYTSFFTDFYYFLISSTDCDMDSLGIKSLDEFLAYCKNWDVGGRSELAGVGNAFGPYYLKVERGGTFATQPTTSFIGYCYQNNKYVDFLEFLEVFFAYWRTDEGYTTPDNYGNDFFASSWAALVDTCKYFYFTSKTLTDKYKWFTYERSPRVHYMLDNTPGVGKIDLEYTCVIGEKIILPKNVYRMNYYFLGWYDESGNRVYEISTEAKVYAKFERLYNIITFKDGANIIKTIKVKQGLRIPYLEYDNELYKFMGWANSDFELYDFLNASTTDLTLYAIFDNESSALGDIVVNAYNTQGATTGFGAYEGLELFKSGVQINANLYWYKVALVKNGLTYQIIEIAPSGTNLTKAYDYLLLAYNSESSGKCELVKSFNLRVGDEVSFSVDLNSLADGSVNVVASFTRSVDKIYNLVLEAGDVTFDYESVVKEADEITLPTIEKTGFKFMGWYESSDFTGNPVNSYVATENKIFYAYFVQKKISSPLDYVSDVFSSTTLDELPSYMGLSTLTWNSSNPDLYKIDNNKGFTQRRYQTHQKQTVKITVEVLTDGKTEAFSKDITINPVKFDAMVHPLATYFSVSSASSYQRYNERYLNDQTLFSDKFKDKMNMVYYAFGIPQENGTVTLNTTYIDQVMELKNSGIRVLLVIDGANRAALQAMVKLCNNDSTRATFVSNICDLIVKYNFDGVDIDWEFPGTSGLSGYTLEIDRTNLNKLLRDLRQKLNSLQEEGGTNYILSIAAPSTYWGSDKYDFDGRYQTSVGGINDYCDYVNMMSYDLNKTSSTSHLTHLHNPSNSYSYGFSVDYGVSYFTSLGLDKNKIIIGSAAYGKAYKVTGTVDDSATYPALGVTGTLGQVLGYDLPLQSITYNSGTIYYTGIQKLLNNSNFKLYHEYNSSNKFVGSYLYSKTDKYFITFDSILSITEKCKYIKANSGMGIMVWAYGEDATDTVINTICDNM